MNEKGIIRNEGYIALNMLTLLGQLVCEEKIWNGRVEPTNGRLL
jgi:hypothetical protein